MIRNRATAIGYRNLSTPAGSRVDAAADLPGAKKREPGSSPPGRSGGSPCVPARPCASSAARTNAERVPRRRDPSHRDTADPGRRTHVRLWASRPPATGRRGTTQRRPRACAGTRGTWRAGRLVDVAPTCGSPREAPAAAIARSEALPSPAAHHSVAQAAPRRAACPSSGARTPAVPASELPGRPRRTTRRRVRRERSVSRKSESTPGASLPIIGPARTAHRQLRTSRRACRSSRDGDRRTSADDRDRIGTGRGVTTRDTPRRNS